jgi:hypothetical protein
MGMRKAEVKRKFDEIVDFAGISDFIDTPVKRYSSGMNARLGFSIAAHLEPDILIIDEVLAVGDAAFQQKAFGRIKSMATAGAPVVLVSHQLDRIAELCTKAILLESGSVRKRGTPTDCIAEYRWGVSGADPAARGIQFERISAPNGLAVYSGEDLTVIVEGRAELTEPRPTWSPAVRVTDVRTGFDVHSLTGLHRDIPLPVRGEFVYRLTFQMNVQPGSYEVHAHIWDSVEESHPVTGIKLRVEVLERMPFHGATQMNSRWDVQKSAAPDIVPINDGTLPADRLAAVNATSRPHG